MRRTTRTLLCLIVVCALGAGAATARADTTGVAADGVTIGPVAVGGMTLEQATRAVLDVYLSPLKVRIGKTTVAVLPHRLHTVAPVAEAVQEALAAEPGAAVPLRARVDPAKLAALVRSLAARYDVDPVASRLLLRRSRPVLTKPQPGLALKQVPTRVLIRNALRDGARAVVVAPLRRVAPPTATQTGVAGPVIVIRRGDNRLTLYHGEKPVRTFKVATGQPSYPTPLGAFHIVVKWKNPTWYPPTQDAWAKGLKPVPPGPGNPLGTRWMGIDSPGVGIHGTDEPASIGYSLSHGCIRMQVPDAEWLFDHVTVGTPVFIVSK
ncbi:MAG TPA: L,D-transpeptidase family protein [Gaiellaceae bacterium]|nr:L,D-transpeptidase family protein [Gaiellaceae bacterium]